MEKKRNNSLILTIGIFIIMISFVIVFLRQAGFFDFTGTDASAEIVSAALVFIGVIFTGTVSIVGMLLRQTMEQRNIEIREQSEKRLQIDRERESNQNKEAERRLRLEAGVEAMKLLTLSEGKENLQTLNAGVLFTLASLPMYDLAVIMLSKMLPEKEVTPDTASWLLDNALLKGDENLQSEAATILYDYAKYFLDDGGSYSWPKCINQKWNLELPFEVREILAFSVLELLLSRKLTDWGEWPLESIVLTLAEIWRTERDAERINRIGAAVGFSLRVILGMFTGLGLYLPSYLIEYYPKEWLIVDDLIFELYRFNWAGGNAGVEYSKRFEKWISSALEQLIEKNVLDLTDNLLANYKGKEYTAQLKARESESSVTIIYNDIEYDSPSSVAATITNTNVNGWDFWRVKDSKGKEKGSLNELRRQLSKHQLDQ